MAVTQPTVPTQPPARSRQPEPGCDRVILRSLPKVVFLYPTMVAAAAAGALVYERPGWSADVGIGFLVVLFCNLVVVSFDFPRTTSLSLLFLAVAVAVGFAWVNASYVALVPPLERLTRAITPEANAQFYWFVGGMLVAICFLVVFVERRFDYWEVNPNQIIHHHGVLHGIERFPAPGLEMQKDITDVFEYLLLGAGRLVIKPTTRELIVLENVAHVNRKEREIQTLLEVLKVEDVGSTGHRHVHADDAL